MAREYLIGVDLGTSATKAALYRADGTQLAEASAEVPLHYPKPGVVEQEQEDFYRTAAETVAEVVRASGVSGNDIAAIGFDSQMAGIGAVDADFRPAIPFDSWLDMRCQPYIERLTREHGRMITERSGCPPTCAHAAKILWWQHERRDDYRRIARFVTPAGFVAGRLAGTRGNDAFMDYTFLHFSSCGDALRGDWSQETCDAVGIDREKLPEIVTPWKIVGETGTSARDFGLPMGIPIVAGAGDTAASALGAGLVTPGMALDVAGTASVLATCTDRYVADVDNRTLLVMRSAVPGLWHPLAYIGGGGLALTWFREQFGGPESDEDFNALAAEADAVPPGADGLLFSPHLGGRICPADPDRRGAWQGFSWGHTRAHFFRSILESVAFEYASYLAILEAMLPEFERGEVRAVGGGARSPFWNQMKADVLGMPYRPLSRTDIATWGVAMVAGHGVGLVPDLAETARAAAATRDGILPRPKLTEAYMPIVRRYIAWQAQQDNVIQ
jgi:xylulokinase